jgi:xanthine/CO dehydrogenase XdhC/CoxF family maturation factor
MLIKANGDAIGTVSGGCLEADVMERAKRVLATGQAEVFTYDTTSHEDSVFSLNMGCRGVMRILMEAVNRASEIFSSIRWVNEHRDPRYSYVVVRSGENGKPPVGMRMSSEPDLVNDEFLDLAPAFRQLAEIVPNYEIVKVPGSSGELAIERIFPPVQVFILGAGADAVPLAEASYELGWQVNVCDHRPAFLTKERFPHSDLVSLDRESTPVWEVDDLTAFVVMNHSYDRDKAMLPGALRSRAFYVGALGPKKRTQQIQEELGYPFSEEELSRLRAPAGLDIGGDTPEAIAISIVAEIQSVFKHRSGGPLRDRQAPIYDRKQ